VVRQHQGDVSAALRVRRACHGIEAAGVTRERIRELLSAVDGFLTEIAPSFAKQKSGGAASTGPPDTCRE
jgi:plasmid stability protein